MISSKLIILFALALFCLPHGSVFAQVSAPTQLALEIRFYPNEPPAFQIVGLTSKRGGWFARFPTVNGAAALVNSPPVSAVEVVSQQAENGVRVWVSVHLGKLHEEEKPVSSYLLREGESVTASELANFGVVPFEIKLVRLPAISGEPPQFRSKARSIELVSIQSNFTPLPTVQMVVRNVSAKPVQALDVRTFQGGHLRKSMMPQSRDGEALIPPGGTLELTAPLASPPVLGANGYAPQVTPDQTITIMTAVFGDGTYEGDSHNAMTFLGFQKGRKSQLVRVVKLFAEAQTSAKDLTWLKEQVDGLSLWADPAAVKDLGRQFSPGTIIEDPGVQTGFRPLTTEDLKTVIELGMKVKNDVLKDITEFEIHSRYKDPGTLTSWLEASKARYQAWLSRL